MTFQTGQADSGPIPSVVEGDPRTEGYVTEDRFSQAVREAMEAVPVSRRELARRAGLSHTTLNDIANGRQRATPSVVESLVEALTNIAQDSVMAGHALQEVRPEAKRELKRCGSTETTTGEPCRSFRTCERCGRCSVHCSCDDPEQGG